MREAEQLIVICSGEMNDERARRRPERVGDFGLRIERGIRPRMHHRQIGFQRQDLAGRDRSKKPLLLLNHFDVVPVDRKAWKVDPFAAVVQNGEIWGRGSMDMKGIGIQQLMALVALKQAGITPARDIVMLSNLEVAGEKFENVRAAIDPQDSAGEVNIGTSILKRFVLVIDFSGHAVWFKAN